MSRRSTAMLPPPAPPRDRDRERDVPMGPPPVPPHQVSPLAISTSNSQNNRGDMSQKYYRLKRMFFILEEQHKRLEDELRWSGERNQKLTDERGLLLDRILELEAVNPPAHPPPLQSASSALPRAFVSLRAQQALQATVREALDEDMEDPPLDPHLTSRHVGPEARKREREEEDARSQVRREDDGAVGSKRKRIRTSKGKEPIPPPPPPPRDVNPPTKEAQPTVSVSGKRIKIKPPVPAAAPAAPPAIASTPPSPPLPQPQQHLAQEHAFRRGQHSQSVSPLSPVPSPNGEYPAPVSSLASLPPHPRQSWPQSPSSHAPGIQSPETLRAIATSLPSVAPQRHAKPKRLKAHTVTSKNHSIPTVPRDKHGRPILPLNVGIMTVMHLGEVCMREHFHTERYIFPVGYQVTRRYLSARDPSAEVVYTCTILDGGDGPKFQIFAADMPDKPIIAGTATGAWSVVVRAANHVRNRQHSNSVSGPDFFGLGQNTIKHLIQELPGAERLRDYVWQTFVEGGDGRPLGGRHAAVVPALPEEPGLVYDDKEKREEMDVDVEELSERATVVGHRRDSRASNVSMIPDEMELPPPPMPHGNHGHHAPPQPHSHAQGPPHPHSPSSPYSHYPYPTHHPPHSPGQYAPSPYPHAYPPHAYPPPPPHHHAYAPPPPPPHGYAHPQHSPPPAHGYAPLPHHGPSQPPPPQHSYRRTPPPSTPAASVPPTFAGIMHAYDAPAPSYARSSGSGSGEDRDRRSERGDRERQRSDSQSSMER